MQSSTPLLTLTLWLGSFIISVFFILALNLQPSESVLHKESGCQKPLKKHWETQFWNVRTAHPDQTDTKMSAEKKADAWAWNELKSWRIRYFDNGGETWREHASFLCHSLLAIQRNSNSKLLLMDVQESLKHLICG